MRNIAPFILILASIALFAVGCGIERTVLEIKGPGSLLYAFASVAGSITLLLFLFSEQDVWTDLLNGLRYTCVIAAVAAPLYALTFGAGPNWTRPLLALEGTGLGGITITTALLWRHERRTKTVPAEKKEEVPGPARQRKKKA